MTFDEWLGETMQKTFDAWWELAVTGARHILATVLAVVAARLDEWALLNVADDHRRRLGADLGGFDFADGADAAPVLTHVTDLSDRRDAAPAPMLALVPAVTACPLVHPEPRLEPRPQLLTQDDLLRRVADAWVLPTNPPSVDLEGVRRATAEIAASLNFREERWDLTMASAALNLALAVGVERVERVARISILNRTGALPTTPSSPYQERPTQRLDTLLRKSSAPQGAQGEDGVA